MTLTAKNISDFVCFWSWKFPCYFLAALLSFICLHFSNLRVMSSQCPKHACLSTCGSFNGYESPEHWRMVKTQETHFNVTLQTLYSLFQSLDHHNLLCWEIFWSFHQLYDLQIILYDKYLMILHYFLKYVTKWMQ